MTMDVFITIVLSLIGLCAFFVAIIVFLMFISIKKHKERVQDVLPKVLSRVNERFLSMLEVVSDTDVAPHCEVKVSDEKTLVNALGKEYSFLNSHFPGGAGFDKLFEIVLRQLMEFEKCVCEKTFCIKCDIDADKDSKAMNDYQMIRAVLCAVYAFGVIHKTSTLITVKVVVDPKHNYAVNEILRDKNYQDFYACEGSSSSMNEYLEKYGKDA